MVWRVQLLRVADAELTTLPTDMAGSLSSHCGTTGDPRPAAKGDCDSRGTNEGVGPVARMESGRMLPSLRTLSRYAEATGSRAVVRLESAQQIARDLAKA